MGRSKLGCTCPYTSTKQLVTQPSTPSCWQRLQAGTHEGVSKVARQACEMWGLDALNPCDCLKAPPSRHPAATSCLAATPGVPIAVSLAKSQKASGMHTLVHRTTMLHPALLPAGRQTDRCVCTASCTASNLPGLVAGIQHPMMGGRAAVLLHTKGGCTTVIGALQALVSA